MRLSPQQLSRQFSIEQIRQSSDNVLHEGAILGQQRASTALQFGLAMQKPGYNLYLAGDSGTGRSHYIKEYLQNLAIHGKAPSDWICVNNFDAPNEPRVIALQHGMGERLQKHIEQFVQELLASFPDAFENPSYIQQRTALQNAFNQRYDQALMEMEKIAAEKSIAVYREEGAISFGILVDGQIAEDAYFSQMNEQEREQFQHDVRELEKLLNESLMELPKWQREVNKELRELLQKTVRLVLKPLFEELLQKYQGQAALQIYFGQMQKHLPQVIEDVFGTVAEQKDAASQARKILLSYYQVNLLTRHEDMQGAAVIYEHDPSYNNLFGYVSMPSQQAENFSWHQAVAAGALHQANGGYLVIEIEKLLQDARSWQSLKRVLRELKHRIDTPTVESATPCHVKPQAMALDVKVVLIGSREIYYALLEADSEFAKLFRVLVDFDNEFELSDAALQQFAQLLQARASQYELAPLSEEAIVCLAQYACRLAGHQQRMTTHLGIVLEIMMEADFWCSQQQAQQLEREHIEQAISAREQRHSRSRDLILQDIIQGLINISTQGRVIGQVNGLAVLGGGESGFGCPLRITATAHPGEKGVVDIEREVKLGQAVHSKGVLILTGYLSGRYAKNSLLAMSANIAVEQSYGIIDGDSASMAELCALKSALIEEPLRQDLALTGSISQFGEVQAIGGVNEKIEGFFDICQAKGLNGKQGVIIPQANTVHLMLAQRVIDAVEAGQFHIYAVEHVDQAMELLCEQPAGSLLASGVFEDNSLNARIAARLQSFAKSC